MNSPDRYTGISILIPGYSVEDIPADLNEEQAAALLNAVAAAWHPLFLAAADGIPQFRCADVHEIQQAGQILLIPDCCHDWMDHSWLETLASGNCLVLHGHQSRDEWLAAAADQLTVDLPDLPADTAEDFFAIGLGWFLVSSLSRRMHYFVDPDEFRLGNSLRDAAAAVTADNRDELTRSLQDCFECLLETREQLFPVDSYLVDLCLPGNPVVAEDLTSTLQSAQALNLLTLPAEQADWQESAPELTAALRNAVSEQRCCVVSGGWSELRTSLGTLSDAWHDLHRAQTYSPVEVWGRQRFGLLHNLPELLQLFDVRFALHFALDDGLYPEREYGVLEWQGPGTTTLPATSRLPLAIDSAAAFLKLPERVAETMQQDASAIVTLARLPRLHTGWLQDLQRIHSWVPLLGQFVTLSNLCQQLPGAGNRFRFAAGEYLPAHLIQSSVLKTEAPIRGPADLYQTRMALESLEYLNAMSGLLKPDRLTSGLSEFETRLADLQAEQLNADPPVPPEQQQSDRDQLHGEIMQHTADSLVELATALPAGTQPGMLLVNSLPFARHCAVTWPDELAGPATHPAITSVWKQADRQIVHCQIPPGGFLQLPAAAPGQAGAPLSQVGSQPLAESGLLRNQLFEVHISDRTGGISEVRFHGQRANRVSQQVAFRYESPRTVSRDDGEAQTTHYATTRCLTSRVLESGPWTGAVSSSCVIEDVTSQDELFRFQQVTRVERNSARVTIEILPDPEHATAIRGNPWMTYLACRFAWDNEAASLTRDVLGQNCGFRGERFEAPGYVEIADADHRLLIIPHARPYHRRSGHRMLDSLLLVEGEPVPSTALRLTLEFDQAWPSRAAADVLTPVLTRPAAEIGQGQAWLLGTSSRNVQVARTRFRDRRLVLLLQETDGRATDCQIRTARKPLQAELQSGTGVSREELEVSEDGVTVNFAPFEVKQVQLTF